MKRSYVAIRFLHTVFLAHYLIILNHSIIMLRLLCAIQKWFMSQVLKIISIVSSINIAMDLSVESYFLTRHLNFCFQIK